MKLSENFYCVAEVVCEHWYLGTNFSQYCICLDEYDYETEETSLFFQKIANYCLDKADKEHLYEDYAIKLLYLYGEDTTIHLSQQFIQNWKEKNRKC